MSNHNDLNYAKKPVHEIDRLRAEAARLQGAYTELLGRYQQVKDDALRQNGVLRDALVKTADWLAAVGNFHWHEQENLIRTTLWNSATPEQRKTPFVEKAELCCKCGKQEASKNFAVCPACYKDPVDG